MPARPAFGRVSWTAAAVAALYFVLSWNVGEYFPFSRVPMYAAAGGHAEPQMAGAVPQFLARGVPANILSFERFVGPDPRIIEPWGAFGGPRYRCSMSYIPERDAQWISNHPGEEKGPVPVSYRYVLLTMSADGKVVAKNDVVWEGTAWPVD